MSINYKLLRYPKPIHSEISPRLDKAVYFHFDKVYYPQLQANGDFLLQQVGDLSCKANYLVDYHLQECYEICYVVSGEGTVGINDQIHAVRQGDLILIIPGDKHVLTADEADPFRLFYIGFLFLPKTNEFSTILSQIQKQFDQQVQRIVQTAFQVEGFFTGIFKELVDFNSHSLFVIEAYLRQIVVFTHRNYYGEMLPVRNLAIEQEHEISEETIYKVVHYLDQHLLEITQLTQVSERFNYSYSHLSRLFSQKIGMTLKEYYTRKRFERAIRWLQEGEQSITLIASQLHYQSIHAFSRAFRQRFGMAPKDYQELFFASNKDK